MQRLGSSVRMCRNINIRSSCGRCFSTSSGPEHDDYWAAAKTEAQATPAYQQAASAAASNPAPPPAPDVDQWATPGNYTPSTRRMPMGDAYGPSATSRVHEGRSMPPSQYTNTSTQLNRQSEPAFDMESSMHLSPVKQVDVRSFMGQTLVDIRQYFVSPGGATLPSKKGISLTVAQWRRLQAAMGEIDHDIQLKEQYSGMDQNGREKPGGQA